MTGLRFSATRSSSDGNDACLSLVRDHKVVFGDLERIHLSVLKITEELAAGKRPKDELEAATSIFYWAAVTMVNGRAGIAEAGKGMLNDVRVAALKERISVSASSELANDQCRLTAEMSDRRRIEISVEHAVGSLDRP